MMMSDAHMGMKIDHVPMSALSSGSTNGSGSSPLPGGMPGNAQNIADYLAQLLKDKNKLVGLPNFFTHVERLLDEEINKVRGSLFQISGAKKEPLVLPDPIGAVMTYTEKVYVPVKEHPDFNFVGRILGPRGMTAKQLEQETGCKIMVRGKGSMRDKKKEEQNRGKPNWEHLNDELHVLITVEDTEIRSKMKLERAVEEIRKLLVPAADGEDELKKRQLMELAIINGTYRDSSCKLPTTKTADLLSLYAPRLLAPSVQANFANLRNAAGNPLGAPLILSTRLPGVPTSAAAMLNGSGPPPLISPEAAGLLYGYADYSNYAAAAAMMAEYPATAGADHAGSTAGKQMVKRLTQVREALPYQRPGTSL
ncbi:protein held out wings-like isoform X2 [Artemia franciscana]|uniref:K Homology domain-containing protein n=1 Tax=Artemia franciscana TaxID=6661 RepID=A0AA88LDG6_ARTSF|nr:hypothetical protein QYM36_008043 [Artemia franciscana]